MPDLIFLHGWGKSKSEYRELLNLTGAEFISLPGFEEPLSRPFNLDDYALWLNNKVGGKTTVITHSFGGRVAVKFAIAHPEKINKLVFIASGGIERKNLKIKLINFLSPVIPAAVRSLLLPYIGSSDYLNATGYLRETLKNVVSENLELLLKEIKVPTLVVWGDKDNTTPVWQGKIFYKNITGSKMIIIKNGDHGIPYRRAEEVAKAINDFI